MWSILLLATLSTVTVHLVTADVFNGTRNAVRPAMEDDDDSTPYPKLDPSILDYDVLGNLGPMMQLFGRSNSLPGSGLRGFGTGSGNIAYPWQGRAGWTSGGFGNPYGQWGQGRGFGGGPGMGFGNSFGK